MKATAPSRRCMSALSILVVLFLQAAANTAAYAAGATDDGMEVLTRGPIHEAFAEVSVDEQQPEVVLRRSVPEPINEVPPDYRPEGENVQWIPGYWSWDEDLNDFIWVSGVWRDIPPGRQWVPGYWVSVADGSRFVSGYWADSKRAETVYLPPPPAPLQAAPGSPAFSADSIWIDGHWLWSGKRYVWQAGYWLRQRPERVWIPAHFLWTPRGYIFVPGFWDYQLVRRGVMFAPRHYSRPIYRTHGYYYTPRIVVDFDAIFLSLFIRRDHRHYYFGDYHDVRYERRGFVPWYSKHATRHGYDPYYKSYRWYRSRQDDQWERKYQQQFEYRRDHREARPPVFYREQPKHDISRSRGSDTQMISRHLPEFIKKNNHDLRFTPTRPDQKKDYQGHDRRPIPPQTERRTGEMRPKKQEKSREDNFINSTRPEKRSVSPKPMVPDQDHFSARQQKEVRDKQHLNPYQRPLNQPQDRQPGSQQQKLKRGVNDQPRADQNKNQRQRPAVTGANQSLERKRVKQTDGKPLDPETQVEEQEEVVQSDGQIMKTPQKIRYQRPGRTEAK